MGVHLCEAGDQDVSGSTEELAGAALWMLPGRWRATISQLAQGAGIGTRLLAPGLELCDREP
jgi:hypothetical protein